MKKQQYTPCIRLGRFLKITAVTGGVIKHQRLMNSAKKYCLDIWWKVWCILRNLSVLKPLILSDTNCLAVKSWRRMKSVPIFLISQNIWWVRWESSPGMHCHFTTGHRRLVICTGLLRHTNLHTAGLKYRRYRKWHFFRGHLTRFHQDIKAL